MLYRDNYGSPFSDWSTKIHSSGGRLTKQRKDCLKNFLIMYQSHHSRGSLAIFCICETVDGKWGALLLCYLVEFLVSRDSEGLTGRQRGCINISLLSFRQKTSWCDCQASKKKWQLIWTLLHVLWRYRKYIFYNKKN